MFVIFMVISLGFLFIPLSVPDPVSASSVILFQPAEVHSTSLVLEWTAHPYQEPDPDGDGTCYLDALEVHKSTTPNFTPTPSTYYGGGWGTWRTIYGLDPSTTYYFRVVVVHKSGYRDESTCSLGKEASNMVSATTLPSGVSIKSIDANPNRPWDSVDISWNANEDPAGFEKYVIERAFAASFSNSVTMVEISYQATERYTITELMPSTAYFFRVAVHATTGKVNPSDPEAVMTQEIPEAIAVVLNPPSDPDITKESVRLSWGEVHDEYCDMYVIEKAKSPDFTESKSATVKDCRITEYNWKGLEAGTTYYFRVTSRNTAGLETTSNTVAAATISQLPPVTEIVVAANTVVLVVILLLILALLTRNRSKASKQE